MTSLDSGLLAAPTDVVGVMAPAGTRIAFSVTFSVREGRGAQLSGPGLACGDYAFQQLQLGRVDVAAGKPPALRLAGVLAADRSVAGFPVAAGATADFEVADCQAGRPVTRLHHATIGGRREVAPGVTVVAGDVVYQTTVPERETGLTGPGRPLWVVRAAAPRVLAGRLAYWVGLTPFDLTPCMLSPAEEVVTPSGVVLGYDPRLVENALGPDMAIAFDAAGAITRGPLRRSQPWRELMLGSGDDELQRDVTFWPDGAVQCAEVHGATWDRAYRDWYNDGRAGGPPDRKARFELLLSQKGEPRLLVVDRGPHGDTHLVPVRGRWIEDYERSHGKLVRDFYGCSQLGLARWQPLVAWLARAPSD